MAHTQSDALRLLPDTEAMRGAVAAIHSAATGTLSTSAGGGGADEAVTVTAASFGAAFEATIQHASEGPEAVDAAVAAALGLVRGGGGSTSPSAISREVRAIAGALRLILTQLTYFAVPTAEAAVAGLTEPLTGGSGASGGVGNSSVVTLQADIAAAIAGVWASAGRELVQAARAETVTKLCTPAAACRSATDAAASRTSNNAPLSSLSNCLSSRSQIRLATGSLVEVPTACASTSTTNHHGDNNPGSSNDSPLNTLESVVQHVSTTADFEPLSIVTLPDTSITGCGSAGGGISLALPAAELYAFFTEIDAIQHALDGLVNGGGGGTQ